MNQINRNDWEILVIDGMSDDKTRKIVGEFSRRYSFIQLLDNPDRIKPVALNRGIGVARGEYIMRVDAHSTYASGYVDDLLEVIRSSDAQNVGGVQVAVNENKTAWGRAIALAMSHPLAMGDALHRMGFLKEPREVETVYCGCYPRGVFRDIGLFNENLIRTQDREFNERLRKAGGKVLLVPSVRAFYKPRSEIKSHARWIFEGARWLFLANRYTSVPMIKLRNWIPLGFVIYLVLALVASVTAAIGDSWNISLLAAPLLIYFAILTMAGGIAAIRERALPLVVTFPTVVFATHLAYGVGSLVGLVQRYW